MPFDDATINAVWRKANAANGYDPDKFRKDRCGKLIARASYGSCTDYGWEIDHMRPVAKGGRSTLENLQPLQWENNRYKSDDYPTWNCKLTSG